MPPYAIVAGNPARVIKYRFNQDMIDYLESIRWWNWDLKTIKENKKFFELRINDIFQEADIDV